MNFGEHIGKMRHFVHEAMTSRPVAPQNAGKGISGEDGPITESSTSLIRSLVGPIGEVGDAYFPPDVVGGVCPRIPGEEEALVWNAAAEACDSERVHVAWQAAGNLIWYLAVRSADLAGHTISWCPLAALLPTAKDLGNLPICYTYFGEDLALLMVVSNEELHIFRGTAAVVRAKAERTAREYGEKTQIVNIDLFRIGQMTPIPWYSVSLFEERARRILATLSIVASLAVAGLAFVVWLSASMAMITAKRDLSDALERTESASIRLLQNAEDLRNSPLRDQIVKFLNVNDGVLALNGLLQIYEVKEVEGKGKVTRWRAIVPPSATADRISAMSGKSIETTDKGVAIGNDAQIDFEASNKEKR